MSPLKRAAVGALLVAIFAAGIVNKQAWGATTTCPSLTTLNYPGSGAMYNYSSTWATVRDAPTCAGGSTSLGTRFVDPTYYIYRGMIAFDSGNVPAENTVDAVYLHFYVSTAATEIPQVQTIDTTSYASSNFSRSHYGTQLWLAPVTLWDVGWYTATLTAANLVVGKGPGGVTRLGLRGAWDVENNADTKTSSAVIRWPGYGANEPYLVVQSHTPSAPPSGDGTGTTVTVSEITTIAGIGPRDAGILLVLLVGATLALIVAALRAPK